MLVFQLQSLKADDCFVFPIQTSALVLLCCSVIRGVIYTAVNEIGLITRQLFFPLILKNLPLEMHFALNMDKLTKRC